jgi:hypothetical protein
MSTAPPSSYLKDRLDKQAKWHSNRAGKNKRRFYAVEIITLSAGALIPVINIFDPAAFGVRGQLFQRLGSALLAGIVVVTAGVGKLFKFQENWLTYRGLSEELEREKELYLNGVGQYSEADEKTRLKLLVERSESILSTTTNRFISLQRAEREQNLAERR